MPNPIKTILVEGASEVIVISFSKFQFSATLRKILLERELRDRQLFVDQRVLYRTHKDLCFSVQSTRNRSLFKRANGMLWIAWSEKTLNFTKQPSCFVSEAEFLVEPHRGIASIGTHQVRVDRNHGLGRHESCYNGGRALHEEI